jgi:hypothetical protein
MGTVNVNFSPISETVDLVGLNNINADLTLGLTQPFKTESANEIDVKPLTAHLGTKLEIEPLKLDLKVDPLKTDSNLSVDLKPVVLDLCLTANIGKVPSLCIRQPYHHHIGFKWYGHEVWGLTFSGQQDTVIEELDRQPKVARAGAAVTWPPRPAPPPTHEPPCRQSGGLRVRLGR